VLVDDRFEPITTNAVGKAKRARINEAVRNDDPFSMTVSRSANRTETRFVCI
jgi:hypothetical protein